MSAVGPAAVAVAACTYHRPVGLSRLLDGLAALEPAEGVEVRVVIADNDAARGAQEQVAARQGSFPYPLHYVCQPEPGIAAARNAALDAAGEVDAVLFLDDDEWPEPGWLREMLRVWRSSTADVVTATVLPHFEQPPPAWAVRGGFFDRPRFPTGTALHYARTSNVLISAAVLTGSGLRFRRTGSAGGEDTLFFQQAHDLGHRIVWADDAVVHESVPASRVSRRWLVRRSFRYGLTRSELLRQSGASWPRRLRRAANGVLTVLSSVVRLAPALVAGDAARVAVVQRAAVGTGLVLGAAGIGYDEYKVVHGS